MTKVVAGSRTERSEPFGEKVDGSHRCPERERQTVTASEDDVGSQPPLWMEEVLREDNLIRALKRVRANKGAPGVNGMTVDELEGFLREHWSSIETQLLDGTYMPMPVRVVEIPKPSGGRRMLGIPTVLDRFIQQAILQVLGPTFDAGFSESSYGFRPGRSAQQAVERARLYIAAGRRWVVDLDLEKFFDQVNHDILMSRVARKVRDKRLLKLIRRYLQAGLMTDGVVSQRVAGTPQGGPLSPLLSNVLLDDLDRELERRGHCFCRYADDCNIYVCSEKAGQRVMASVTDFLEQKLKLRVNRVKSAVGRPWRRKFLGYSVTVNLKPRLRPAPQSIQRAKTKVRDITRRGRGRNIRKVIAEINSYTRGWFGYFRLADGHRVFEDLDKWIRRRLRKILWQQWKRPRTRYKKLQSFGLVADRARVAAASGRGPWWNAGGDIQAAVTNQILSEWGLLSLLQMHRKMIRVV